MLQADHEAVDGDTAAHRQRRRHMGHPPRHSAIRSPVGSSLQLTSRAFISRPCVADRKAEYGNTDSSAFLRIRACRLNCMWRHLKTIQNDTVSQPIKLGMIGFLLDVVSLDHRLFHRYCHSDGCPSPTSCRQLVTILLCFLVLFAVAVTTYSV